MFVSSSVISTFDLSSPPACSEAKPLDVGAPRVKIPESLDWENLPLPLLTRPLGFEKIPKAKVAIGNVSEVPYSALIFPSPKILNLSY